MGDSTIAQIRDFRQEMISYKDSGQILHRETEDIDTAGDFLYVDPFGGRHIAKCIAPGVFEYKSGNSWRKVKEVITNGQFTGKPEPEELFKEVYVEHRTMIGFSLICPGFATFEHRYKDHVSSMDNWDSQQVFDENGNLVENGFRRAGTLIPVESDKVIEGYR